MIHIENYKIIPIGRCKDLSNIITKNKNDKLWTVCDYNLILFGFIVKGIYCMFKYEVMELGKYGRQYKIL